MNKKSGFYKNGKSHAEGGIPVLVDDNTPIEVEQFEYKLCNNAMNSTKIFEFKDKTNKEILDEIFRYSDCEFEQHKANSGDFIICKLAVMDKKKRNITGTAKEIINVMQSEKSCNVSNDSKEFKDGGSVNNTNLLAPNGKPSNLNEIQYYLVRTKEFKAWFGDWEKAYETENYDNVSKVIDEETKEPLVVYHGTYVENPFYIFDFNKADIGFHFGTLEQAKNRSETKLFFKNHKSIINPFFLNIRNLFSVTDIGDWEYPQRYIDMFISDNLISEIDAKKLGFFRAYEREDNKQIREYLIKKYINIGFEYSNKYEGSGNSYIVLEPNQIKLADGTNTTFDANNPDIRYAKGGEVNDETYTKWKNLVNMSKSELEKFYESKEGKEAGLSSSEAKEQGISSGRESARWIMKMKDTPKSEWTPTMWKWANKQISFISRMSGMKGDLYDDNGNKTRKHTSLLIWGHNPKKYKDGGELSINNEITIFDETKYDDNGKDCYWKTYTYNDSSISIDYCLGDFFKIDAIITKEKSRRNGDASKLIDYAKEIALQNNFQKIDVYLPIDENTPRPEYTLEDYKKAVSFYKKNGFEFYTNSTVKMFFDLNKILKNGGELNTNEMENKEMEKPIFDFMKSNPMQQARALTVLEKRINVDGKIQPFYKWIENMDKGLEISTDKIYSSKSEKGYVERPTIGDNIVHSKAEQEYYKYLQTGGEKYSVFLNKKKKYDDLIKAEQDAKRQEADKIREEENKIREEKFKKAKNEEIKELIEKGFDFVLNKRLSWYYNRINELKGQRKSASRDNDIAFEERMILQKTEQLKYLYKIATELYKIENGEVVKKYDWKVGDKVLYNGKIQTTILEVREPFALSKDVTYKVEKKDGIYNQYISYDGLFPIESDSEKQTLQGGKADKLTIEDIAKKHNVFIEYAKEQLNKGMKIESEHTKDTEKQKEIALDHLSEFIEYYNELDKMEEKLKQQEQDKTYKVYDDIKSCLIVEGDDENSYIFEGKEFINKESGRNERWKIISFFKYGVNVSHLVNFKLTNKSENAKLTFEEIRAAYKDGLIEIDGIENETILNNCLKLLTKCIDIIDANEATKSEIEKHNLSKQEIEKLKNKILEIEEKSKKEVEKLVEPIEIIEPETEIKEQSNEQKELKEAINTFEELIKLGGTDAEMKEWQEAVDTFKMLLDDEPTKYAKGGSLEKKHSDLEKEIMESQFGNLD